ncbi:MAG TPA: glutaredoxin family protein [Anaerolineales bacterium]|nr:glutaredoxin family protein [Anaerolineales bacterium]
MPDDSVLNVTLYMRADCGLCDEVRAHLRELQRDIPHRLAEIDIDADPVLREKYHEQIPVIEVGPYVLRAPISRQDLKMTLGAARDRRDQLVVAGGEDYRQRVNKGRTISPADGAYFWLARHYLAILNLIIFVYVGLPFLAPVLEKVNSPVAARVIYRMYSPLCHQFAFRSFFLFGEQPFYPLQEAGLSGVKTFEQVSGLKDLANPYSTSRLDARAFAGNSVVGYKVALCERDVAIYGAMLLFGLIYAATGRRLRGLHWLVWILFFLGPIGLDGFSQLFSQLNLSWLAQVLPYRESTPFLRVLTGGLFGFGTAWFAVPNIEESMRETRQIFIKKSAVAKA